jgi:hypothetical protein
VKGEIDSMDQILSRLSTTKNARLMRFCDSEKVEGRRSGRRCERYQRAERLYQRLMPALARAGFLIGHTTVPAAWVDYLVL